MNKENLPMIVLVIVMMSLFGLVLYTKVSLINTLEEIKQEIKIEEYDNGN